MKNGKERVVKEGIMGNNNYVHIQSILPKEDVIALRAKTGESSIKDALSKAIYYYLEYGPYITDEEIEKLKKDEKLKTGE